MAIHGLQMGVTSYFLSEMILQAVEGLVVADVAEFFNIPGGLPRFLHY